MGRGGGFVSDRGRGARGRQGPVVWDMLAHTPDKIWNNQNGDVACDHYHRYREDVAIMKQIGLKAYRLSVSWPRVIPAGTGAVNPQGLAFYDRLVDELLAAGIQPYVTLFHWDYPYDCSAVAAGSTPTARAGSRTTPASWWTSSPTASGTG